jgi:proline dehydrogenase
MQLMRSTLLWASRNGTLERVVKSSRLMRPLVSRFMPGETIEDAMGAVRALQAEKTPTILTYLGENVTTDAAADQTVQEYENLFAAVRAAGADVHVSIKLTQFGWDIDQARALDRVRAMARLAADVGTMLPIDMEGSPYVESTVAAYEKLAREFQNVALCLQAYLHRTPQDLKRLLAVRPYIRLVKGAYREPADVALQARPDIDARYRALGQQLLDASKSGARVAFGTHDVALVENVRAAAAAAGVDPTSFEVQMLYGIQDAARRQLAASGLRTRVLISYGRAWYPWFMRRLAEKPANLLLVGRSVVGG